jgi:hypothetical protein
MVRKAAASAGPAAEAQIVRQRRNGRSILTLQAGEPMRTLRTVVIGWALLTARLEGQATPPQLGEVIVRDSAVARVVAAALFEQFAHNVANAAFDATTHAVTLTFPDSDAPEAWRPLRAHLLQAVHGRTRQPEDVAEWYAIVGEARVDGYTLTVHLTIGNHHRCKSGGKADRTTTEQWYLVRSTRGDNGPWSVPTVTWAGESLGVPCELMGSPRRE